MYLCMCLSFARAYKFVCGRDSSYMAIDLIGSSGCERVAGLPPRRFNSIKNYNSIITVTDKSCEPMTFCILRALIFAVGPALSLWINLYDSWKLHPNSCVHWRQKGMRTNIRMPLFFVGWGGGGEGFNYFCVSWKKLLNSQRLEPAITKNVPHGETFFHCIKLQKMWNLFCNISAARVD